METTANAAKHSLLIFSAVILTTFFHTANVWAGTHPQLFFSSSDIASLRTKAMGSHSSIYSTIKNKADALLSQSVPTEPVSPSFDNFADPAKNLLALALVYTIENNPAYLNKARDYMAAFAGWTNWGDGNYLGGRDLGFAHMLMFNAFAFDWLYNDLSVSDRAAILSSLVQRTGESYAAASNSQSINALENWWRRSYAQNHWSTNISALGIASLAIEGESGYNSTWLDYAKTEIQKDKFILDGIADGTWHEGPHYQAYKFTMSLPFYYNLNRIKSINYMSDTYLDNVSYWWLYNYVPSSSRKLFNFADINENWGVTYAPFSILRFIASQYNNGYAQWLAQQILSQTSRNTSTAALYVFEFFYYNPSVTPVSPTVLPTSRTFNDLGAVTWRTGWGNSDLIFGLKSSAYGGRFIADTWIAGSYPFNVTSSEAHTGHDHPDANSFYLLKGQVDLSSEKTDYQQTNNTGFHNTLMVDQAQQYKPNWYKKVFPNTDGFINTVSNTPDFNYLSSDAANRYRAKNSDGEGTPGSPYIDEFTRFIIFVKPDYLVMVDDIRSSNTHRYDWISHAGTGGNVTMEDDWIKVQSSGADILGIKVLSPAFSYDIGISSYTGDNFSKPYIRTRPTNNTDNVRFINVLYPANTSGWGNKPKITKLEEDSQGAGVRVNLNGTQDHIFKYGTNTITSIDEYRLTGNAASVLKDGSGNLTKIFMAEGSLLSDTNGNRVLTQMSDGNNKTYEVVYNGTALLIYGDNLSGLKVYAPGVNASEIRLNDSPVTVTQTSSYITISSDASLPPAAPRRLRVK